MRSLECYDWRRVTPNRHAQIRRFCDEQPVTDGAADIMLWGVLHGDLGRGVLDSSAARPAATAAPVSNFASRAADESLSQSGSRKDPKKTPHYTKTRLGGRAGHATRSLLRRVKAAE
jgi:hypothetical protein